MTLSEHSIVVIGSGNVSSHISMGLYRAGARIAQVCSRNQSTGQALARRCDAQYVESINAVKPDASLYLCMVPDSALKDVAQQLDAIVDTKAIVAHTCGTVSIEVFAQAAYQAAVFYPLQTFSKERSLDLHSIPFLLEAQEESVLTRLQALALLLTHDTRVVNSADRRKVHLAAVIVSNFSSHLLTEAFDYIHSQELEPDILYPLIKESVNKVMNNYPADVLTGPAKRNDVNTINMHLDLIEENSDLSELYKMMTNQILKKYHESRI